MEATSRKASGNGEEKVQAVREVGDSLDLVELRMAMEEALEKLSN
jgi:hypothetical protein